ncbi:hypothetical protein V865_005713 [Kwoniella europaea PYCC6329]|uniref:Uncharacterized protein n=1 Tax=Kwoniella europaea PYCC6329 TaxID=1423913 RepID=A0AAX4KP67_9TREE
MAYSGGHGINPSAFASSSSDIIPYAPGRYYQPGHIIGEEEDPPASAAPSSSTNGKTRQKPHSFENINDPLSGTEEQEQERSCRNPWEEGFRSARETLSRIFSSKSNESGTDTRRGSSIPPSPTVEDYPEETNNTNDTRGPSSNFDSSRAGTTNDRHTREEEPARGRSNQRGAEQPRPGFNSTESTNRFPRQPSPEKPKQKRSATPFTKNILSSSESESDSESNDEMPSNDTSRHNYMSGANGPGDTRDNKFQDFFSRWKSSYNQPHSQPQTRGDTYYPQMSTDQSISPFMERIRNRLKKRSRGDKSTGQSTNVFGSANSSRYPHYGRHPMSSMHPSMGYMGQPPPPWTGPFMDQSYGSCGEPPMMDPSTMGMAPSMMGMYPSMTGTNPSMMSYESAFSGWGPSPPTYNQSIGSHPGFFPAGPEPINNRLSRLTAARVAIEAKAAAAAAASAATSTPTASTAASNTPTNLSQLLGSSGPSHPLASQLSSLGGQSNATDPNSRWPEPRIASFQGRRIEIPPFRTLDEAISAQMSESQFGPSFGSTQQSDLNSRSMQDRMVTLQTGTGQSFRVPVPAGRSVNEVVDLLRRSGQL